MTAKNYYALSDRSLPADLASLTESTHGVVVWTPRLVMLLKAVDHTAGPTLWMEGEAPSPDAWYVHLLAGDFQLALEWSLELPLLPYFCFQRGLRDERVHILPRNRLPYAVTGITRQR